MCLMKGELSGAVEEGLRRGKKAPGGRCAQQAKSRRPGCSGREALTRVSCGLGSCMGWGPGGKWRVLRRLCMLVLVMLMLTFLSLVIMDKYQQQPHLLDPHLGKNRLLTLILVIHFLMTTKALVRAQACVRVCVRMLVRVCACLSAEGVRMQCLGLTC